MKGGRSPTASLIAYADGLLNHKTSISPSRYDMDTLKSPDPQVDDEKGSAGGLSNKVKKISQKYRKFNQHFDLVDQVSHRTAELIHRHMKN